MEKVTLYDTLLEGTLNAVQQECLTVLSTNEVQKHLSLFHGLHKKLHDSMHYLYDDMRITYPQLMTAAYKAELEQRGPTGGGHPSKIGSGRWER